MMKSHTETNSERTADPHRGQPVRESGAPLRRAGAAMIMLHGRGAQAESILWLSDEFAQPDILYLAPQAAGRTWYPFPFTVPARQNEPHLGSALNTIGRLIEQLADAGIAQERIVLAGFSQGACLALHYAAMNSGRYGGIVSLSGSLIGDNPEEQNYSGNLEQTPVFLGVGENEHYFSIDRFRRSAAIMRSLNGNVTTRIYPDTGHSITEDEVKFIRGMLSSLLHNQNKL